jgi:hypothetical protein
MHLVQPHAEPPENWFPSGIPVANRVCVWLIEKRRRIGIESNSVQTRIVPDMDKKDSFVI